MQSRSANMFGGTSGLRVSITNCQLNKPKASNYFPSVPQFGIEDLLDSNTHLSGVEGRNDKTDKTLSLDTVPRGQPAFFNRPIKLFGVGGGLNPLRRSTNCTIDFLGNFG